MSDKEKALDQAVQQSFHIGSVRPAIEAKPETTVVYERDQWKARKQLEAWRENLKKVMALDMWGNPTQS